MNTWRTLDHGLRRQLLFLFLGAGLFWSSVASMLPVLPLYARSVGGNPQEVGLVMGSLAVGILLSRSWVAKRTDREGRKWVMILGLTVALIAPLGYIFVHSIPWLIAVRVVHGLSIAAFGTGSSALAVDLVPPSQRGQLIGYMSLVNPIGLAVGPALAGFLQTGLGFTPVFLMASGFAALGLILLSGVKEPPLIDSSKNEQATVFWSFLGRRSIWVLTVIMVLTGMIFGIVSTFVPLFLKEEQVALNPGLFYTALAFASCLARIVSGSASDRYGRGLFVSLSLGLYAFGMLLLWSAHDAPMFLAAGFVEGLGGGMLFPMVIALSADRAQTDERARVLGLTLGGFDLGVALAGPILGGIALHLGIRNMFALATLLALIALVIFVSQNGKALSQSLKFALGQSDDIYALKSETSSTVG